MRLSKADIILRVRDILNESVEGYWLDADLLDSLNEGQRILSYITHAIQDIRSASTVANNRQLSITDMAVRFVEYSGVALRRINIKSIGQLPVTDTTPHYFFQLGETIQIEPIPDDVYTLTLYVSSLPTDMSGDEDVSSLPVSYDMALVYYTAMKGFVAEGNQVAAKTMEALMLSEVGFHQIDKSTYVVEDYRSVKSVVIPEPRGK